MGALLFSVLHLMLTLTFPLVNTPNVTAENSSAGYVIRLH